MQDKLTISSTFATNVGLLVLNLAAKGLFVKIGLENSIIGGQVLMLQVSNTKASLKEAIPEMEVSAIQDARIIADAIHEKLRKMKA